MLRIALFAGGDLTAVNRFLPFVGVVVVKDTL